MTRERKHKLLTAALSFGSATIVLGIYAVLVAVIVEKDAALRTQVDWEQQLAQCNNQVDKRTSSLAACERRCELTP